MDFSTLQHDENGQTPNPYAAKTAEGDWIEGTTSVDFLNANFGQYATADGMIAATGSEGLKLYFAWLRDNGKLN